jgi:hypothetical protein
MSGYEEAAKQFGGQMADPSAPTAPDYIGIAAKFGGKVDTAKQVATNAYQGASDWFAETFGPNGNLRGSAIGGVMQGMADPVAGAAQFAANLPGVRSLAGESVNSGILAKESEYEAARARAGRVGFDAARLSGNIAAPSNVALASRIPAAAGFIGRAGSGAAAGAIGAAMTPETDTDTYWGKTAQKAAVGGAAGAVLAPVAGAVGDRIGRMFGGSGAPPSGGLQPIPGAPGTHAADAVIARAAAEAGQSIDDIPQSVLYQLRAQAQHALSQNQTLDTAAALRKADFEAIGQQPLLGQITRDPMQFAREKNLRGIAGAGEPIAARLSGQTEGLSRTLSGFAQGADEAFAGGQKIARGLVSIDARARGVVDDAYNAARDSAGRYVDLDNVGFVKAANDALDEGMLGHYLPAQVRNMLNDVSTGKIPLNVNTAVQMDSVLSAAQRGALPAERKALGAVRDALNSASPANNTGADALAAFQGARKLAAERFKLHDAIPALKAAADGDVPADDFVRKFVINGDALELRGMAKLLKEHAPESYQQARAQIGAELRRSGFGENVAGDKPFSQERFNAKLRQMGTAKLQAFFTPEEIATMRTVGRVGSYMESPPAGSAVNFSNSASAVANVAQAAAPGVLGKIVGGARWAARAAGNNAAVGKAMRADVPRTSSGHPPGSRRLNELLILGSAGAGAGSGRQ